jgi:L,D-transpeptidase ErfK/SrfK
VRTALTLLLLAAAVADPPTRITGGVTVHDVARGESLTSIGARAGIEPRTIARDNGLSPSASLRPGQRLVLDNRHIIPPATLSDGVVLNLPQRMLFVLQAGELAGAFPVAVGRSNWRTPVGSFRVAVKELDPVWDVPISIQQEMAREGKPVLTRVKPGADNPLGDRWIGLNLPAVGIHGTNAPSSIYRFTTHGCIRMHPDDVARLFGLVEVGTEVHLIYEPVLLATAGDQVLLEVHADAYRTTAGVSVRAAQLLSAASLGHLAGSPAVRRALAERAGRAVQIAP